MQGPTVFSIYESGNREALLEHLDNPLNAFAPFQNNPQGDTLLHVALRDRDHALARLLLDRGASTRALGSRGATPLAVACTDAWCDLSLLTRLAAEKDLILHPAGDWFPIELLLFHTDTAGASDEQLVPRVKILLSALAENDYLFRRRTGDDKRTIFEACCQIHSAKMVDTLLNTNPMQNVHALLENSVACFGENHKHGAAIIKMFEEQDVPWVLRFRVEHTRPFIVETAFRVANLEMLEALRQSKYAGTLQRFCSMSNIVVNIETIHVAHLMRLVEYAMFFKIRLGRRLTSSLETCWVWKRNDKRKAYFGASEADIKLKLKICEPRHLHEHLLEAIVRGNELTIKQCMAVWANPLIPNSDGKRAIDLAPQLASYAAWAPWPVQRTWWRGPFFQARARTLMLMCQRWIATGERVIPRELCHIIIGHVADAEVVYVPGAERCLIN